MIIHAKDYVLRNFVMDDASTFYSRMHNDKYKFFKIYLKGNSTMAFNKSRNQCVVIEGGKWVKVTNNHVGKDVYDKKTNEKIGTLVERNRNTNMLQLRLLNGTIVTIRWKKKRKLSKTFDSFLFFLL